MDKPYIILHMTTSLDGKVTGNFLAHECGQSLIEEYYLKTLMLEGGGYTDTLFAQSALIDEISLVVVPVIESDPAAVDLFAKKQNAFTLSEFSLISAKPLPSNGLWLNYKQK